MDPPAADVERRHLGVLLVVVAATGVVDAACLLHLGTFTAYLTGSVILFGAHLVGAAGSPVPSAIAIASFVAGAAVGARLVRRRVPRNRQLGDLLLVVAVLVAGAAVVAGVAGVGDDVGARATTAVLGVAMGAQMAVIRAAGVTDVVMAAVTGVTYSLVADSPAGGGRPLRTGRRLGVVAALFGGAVVGAGVARWAPWAAWAVAAAVLAGAAGLAWATLPRSGAADAGR